MQLEIGAVFPQSEIGSDPSVIKDFAQAAEALGYSHVLVYDHVLGAHPEREPRLTGPYTHETPFHEPFVLLGFLAAHTQRLGLVTGVIILPQRQTALVAKQMWRCYAGWFYFFGFNCCKHCHWRRRH